MAAPESVEIRTPKPPELKRYGPKTKAMAPPMAYMTHVSVVETSSIDSHNQIKRWQLTSEPNDEISAEVFEPESGFSMY